MSEEKDRKYKVKKGGKCEEWQEEESVRNMWKEKGLENVGGKGWDIRGENCEKQENCGRYEEKRSGNVSE